MGLITPNHLKNWASEPTSKSKTGELISRLIRGSVEQEYILKCDFLLDGATYLGDWDGIVETQVNFQDFLPLGRTVWEIGTGQRDRQKIREDFDKRKGKELPIEWDKSETIYVAISFWLIDSALELENELKIDSPWENVKVIGASQLADWINQILPVQTWCQEIGIGPSSRIKSLEKFWRNWAHSDISPPITSGLILCNREEEQKLFLESWETTSKPIHIKSDTPEEVVAFVYSVFEKNKEVLQNIVVVEDKDLIDSLENIIPSTVILLPPASNYALRVSYFTHKVIASMGNISTKLEGLIELKRPGRHAFKSKLLEIGYLEGKAEVEARSCGSSPSYWRILKLLENGNYDQPNFFKRIDKDRNLLVAINLFSSWSDNNENDKDILSSIAGVNYNSFKSNLIHYITDTPPIIIKVSEIYNIISPVVTFHLFSKIITDVDLREFRRLVTKVFEENLEDSIKYSEYLKNSIAETLLRIAVFGNILESTGQIPENLKAQEYVDSIIRSLKGLRDNPNLIMSLDQQLPVLMEASSDLFLEALDHLLQGDKEKIREIFLEGAFGKARHINLLWGLETLAWIPSYFSNAAMILFKLSEIDPGGKLSNRPLNSLREIFLAWKPNTWASVSERLSLMDRFIIHNKDLAWKLIIELLPKGHSTSSPTRKPLWRFNDDNDNELITHTHLQNNYSEFFNRAIDLIDNDIEKANLLVGYYAYMFPMVSAKFIVVLNNMVELISNDEPKKLSFWKNLNNYVSRNLKYHDSNWALNREQMYPLIELLNKTSTEDNFSIAKHLFDDHYPQIQSEEKEYEKIETELKKKRDEIVIALMQDQNKDILVELIAKVKVPYLIAYSYPINSNYGETVDLIIKCNSASDNCQEFTKHLSFRLFSLLGNRWINSVTDIIQTSHWSAKQIVNLFELLKDSKELFDLIDTLGQEVKNEFWLRRKVFIEYQDHDLLLEIIKNLLTVGRVLDILHLDIICKFPKETIFSILNASLHAIVNGKEPTSFAVNDPTYTIPKVFKKLFDRTDIDKMELAEMEYIFCPILLEGYEKSSPSIHFMLSQSPEYFIKILSYLYKPENVPPTESEENDDNKINARNSWYILYNWKNPPGIEKGKIFPEKFNKWINDARRLAKTVNRSTMADQEIGKVLSFFLVDPDDGAWPHKLVRELIESLESEELEKGIYIQVINNRGFTSRGLLEGGKQERIIATKWKQEADKIGSHWPRTKKLCLKISKSYERDAEREDQESEKMRLDFD